MTTENFGIKVKPIKENGTSHCPWCGSKNVKKHRSLLECSSYGIEAYKDAVVVLNIIFSAKDGLTGVLVLASENGCQRGSDVYEAIESGNPSL